MLIDEKIVIKDYDVVKCMSQHKIVIYGAGTDAKLFYEKYSGMLDIDFFIAKDKNISIDDKKIYSVDKCLSCFGNRKIIICSRKYAPEMIETLKEYGLKENENFYVWDADYTQSVKEYIDFNNTNIRIEVSNNNNVVLVPIEGCHDGTTIVYSYFAPYYANKCNANIVGYIRQGGNEFESVIYPSMVDIYKSFGMREIIKVSLQKQDEESVESIYDSIIKNIRSYDDWSNIVVNGRNIGISFLRDYLRKYQLSFDPRNEHIFKCLRYAIKTIIFWDTYFEEKSVKTVILWDGVHNESYLRDIAIENGAKTYIIHPFGIHKAFINFSFGESFEYLNDFYERLTLEEKTIGLAWAKKAVDKILSGKKGKFLKYRISDNVFSYESGGINAAIKKKTRVMICPHIFDEDQWLNGRQLCGENYISWLLFIGDISQKTDYEWFIKLHPDETDRGNQFILEYLKLYPNISLISANLSPYDLKKAGIDYSLTIGGSIGHEYPLLGINVINAGNNPHMSFAFNILPQSKEEYEKILMNITSNSVLENVDEIYKFYCIFYLYYKRNDYSKEIQDVFNMINFNHRDINNTIYYDFMNEFSIEIDRNIKKQIKMIDKILESRQLDGFYMNSKKDIKEMLLSVE